MKWIGWAAIALVISPGQACVPEPGCDDWNTPGFFQDADGDLVRKCLAAVADFNAQNEYGSAPLLRAAFFGNAEAIAALLAAGADPNARGKYGETPLHRAAYQGHAEAIAALLAAGADPNAQDKDGVTPLHRAALFRHAEAIAALLAAGANRKRAGQ